MSIFPYTGYKRILFWGEFFQRDLRASQGHFEQAAGNPLATAGVELLTAANQSLEYVETVEVTNLPDGIKAMLKFDNMKPFQFLYPPLGNYFLFFYIKPKRMLENMIFMKVPRGV